MTAEWMDRAACVGVNPELFFPVSESGPALAQIAKAKQVCGPCPVRAECLDAGMAFSGDLDGVWGGRSAGERRALVRRATRRCGEHSRPVPPGGAAARAGADADEVVVQRLMTKGRQPGATSADVASAGLALLAKGWTRNAVARHLGIGDHTVSSWLVGGGEAA